MIILGIDPGLATMGYGVVEKLKNDNTVAVDYGVVGFSDYRALLIGTMPVSDIEEMI